MYIKPKKEQSKPKQSKSVKLDAVKPEKQKIPNEFLERDELLQLSRDYVIEHEGLTILSWDYVIENGKMFGESLWWDRQYGYYICDFTGEEEVYFTGLAYGIYKNGNLHFFQYYENGEEHGLEVKFYPSGEIESYGVTIEKRLEGNYYEWYENGMIKRFIGQDNNCYEYIECDEQGKIIKRETHSVSDDDASG